MRTFVHVQNFFFGPAFSSDHRRLQRSPAFTQSSSVAIPATMDEYQRFLYDHIALTRTSWCDGALRCFKLLFICFLFSICQSNSLLNLENIGASLMNII